MNRKTLKRATDSALNLYDNRAEQVVMAAVLRGGDVAELACSLLAPEAFSELDRVLVFEAAKNLLERNQPVTPAAVLAETRIAAGRRRIEDMTFINDGLITRLAGEDLTGIDVPAYVRRLEALTEKRRVTPVVEQILNALASGMDQVALRNHLAAIVTETIRQTPDKRILYGWQAEEFVEKLLKETQEMAAQTGQDGVRLPSAWPWKAMADVPVPVPGMVATFCAPDGAGKTSFAEICSFKWAMEGVHVGYAHTEYDHPFMMARRACHFTGVSMRRLLRNFTRGVKLAPHDLLTAEEYTRLQQAQRIWDEKLNTLHLISAGGMTVRDVLANAYAMRRAGQLDFFFLDYFHDLDFPDARYGNEYTTMGRDMKYLHHGLADLGVPALIILRGKKEMIGMPTDKLSRNLIDGAAAVLYKSQLTILMARDELEFDGQDTTVVVTPEGRHVIACAGKKGDLAKRMRFRVDKSNISETCNFSLWHASGYTITDVPPEIDLAAHQAQNNGNPEHAN